MTGFVNVRVTGLHDLQKYVGNLEVDVPKAIDIDMKEIAKEFKRGLKEELITQGTVWTGRLLDEIGYAKSGEHQYVITMPKYGLALDSMKPHLVKIAGKPELGAWSNDHLGGYKGVIEVKPHPFIDAGIMRGMSKIQDRLENGEVLRIVRKKNMNVFR